MGREHRIGAVLLHLALLLGGCGPALPYEEESAMTDTIVGGRDSFAWQDAVVMVRVMGGGLDYRCTGSMIAPNLLLTARHCVSVQSTKVYKCDENGIELAGNGKFGADVPVDQVHIVTGCRYDAHWDLSKAPKAVKYFFTDTNDRCTGDLALVLIDQDLKYDLPVELKRKPAPADFVGFVGWGGTLTQALPDFRQRRDHVAIRRRGPAQKVLSSDWGGRGDIYEHALPATVFEVGESFCDGDSGGPALDQMGRIVGVIKGGSGYADDPKIYASAKGCMGESTRRHVTMVQPFEKTITHALQEARLAARKGSKGGFGDTATPADKPFESVGDGPPETFDELRPLLEAWAQGAPRVKADKVSGKSLLRQMFRP